MTTRISISSPYKGLAPFEDSDVDALLFFGRAWETEVVAANVLASRLTVLYGPSGVGKSSLLRAGVVRALRHSGEPSPAVAYFGSWAGEPLAGIEESARAAVTDALGRAPADAPGDLTDRFAAWSAELGAELCLLVDQLEELFLYHPAKEGAAGFVDLLPELVLRPGLRVNVLLGVRDDALAQLDVFKERIPGLFMNSLRLDHLDREAAREAILGPLARFAAIAGAAGAMTIEPELVDDVLDEVSAGRIEPSLAGRGAVEGVAQAARIETPYLQLVLQRLWEVERERGSQVLRQETLQSLGGSQQIIEDHLERALRALSPAEQDAAANVFDHLVTPSGTKIAHGVGDLASYASVGERDLEPVLDSLARQRILRPLGENGHAGGRYEIFHDVLAGAVLAWRTRHEADTALAEERKRRRRLGWIAIVALIGLAVMSGVALYAVSQRSEAQKQTEAANAQRAIAESTSAELASSNQKLRVARDDANNKAEVAAKARRDAQAQAQKANAASQRATELQKVAEEKTVLARAGETHAKSSEADAKHQAALATQAKEDADAQRAKAEDQRRKAQDAVKKAQEAGQRANARFYIARSVGLVKTDPQTSANNAVLASGLAVKKGDRLDAENALRAALVAMRLEHILPGVGSDGSRDAHFSADGRRAVVAGGPKSRSLRVYRSRDGHLLGTFRAGATLNHAALSRDGRFAAAAGADGHVWVWDVNAGTVRTFDHEAPVSGVAWSPANDTLVSVGVDPRPSARLWDASTGTLLHALRHPLPLAAAVFSPDGRRLATYGVGRFARVFDVSSGTLVSTLKYPAGGIPVTSAAFSPSGDTIVTGRGNFARLWNADSGDVVTIFGGHTQAVTDVAFSADGNWVATGSIDTVARVWNVATGGLGDSFYGHTGLGINDVDFSPDSSAIVTAGSDHTARFSARGQLPVPLLGHDGPVLGASFSPDGRSVLTSSKDGTARLWDPYGEPVPKQLASYPSSVTSVAVDPGSSRIAVGEEDGSVHVLSADGRLVSTPIGKGRRVVSVAWARGRKLMAATDDGHVRIWDGTSLSKELDHGAPIRAASISPDGAFAATAGQDKRVRLWRLATGSSIVLRHDAAVAAVAFAPSGRVLATASGEAAYTWSTTGSRLATFEPEGDTGNVTGVAFGDQGRLLATSSDDSYARVWNAKTGELRNTLVRHGGTVFGVAFSPDGGWLATVGVRKAGVWQAGDTDLEGNFLLFTALPRPQQAPLTSVAFGKNRTIVMGNRDGKVLAYQCRFCGRLPQLVRIARVKLARLSDEARR